LARSDRFPRGRQPFRGVDRATVTGERNGEEASGREQGAENVAGKVARTSVGDEVEDLGGAEADARIHPTGPDAFALGVRGTFQETRDPAVGGDFHHAVGAGTFMDQEGGQGIPLPVKLQQGGEVLVGDHVAVLNEKLGFGTEVRGDVPDPSGGAEESFLE
jgi:hypothetical protein